MAGEHGTVTGTLLRRQDGTLYFIPEEQLEAYRVPDEARERAEQMLEEQAGEVQAYSFVNPNVTIGGTLVVPSPIVSTVGSTWATT